EGADFHYSLDGGATQHALFTVEATGPGETQTFTLPDGTAGAVRIELRDAQQAKGEAVDSVHVDHLLITSYTQSAEAPAAPSELTIGRVTPDSVSLGFTDNSKDEWGFEIWRKDSAAAPVDCNDGAVVGTAAAAAGRGGRIDYSDLSVAPGSSYWYQATSFNDGGDTGCSGAVQAVTPASPASSLTVSAYKVKGTQRVDLQWYGIGGTNAVIFRDDVAIAPAHAGDVTATDDIGRKGAGSYLYRVCETADRINCTPEATAVF
ncbi:MAG: hypothetical protein RQ826_15410, partial [Xanthomonadales bacterium]|nr:hypothetical protein [Xanthomonadales bacterium]